MKRLFGIVLAGVVAWLVLTNRLSVGLLDPTPVGIQIDGSSVVRYTDDAAVRFDRTGVYEDTLMLYGTRAPPLRNQIAHAKLTGLPIREARALAHQVPDLGRFDAAGPVNMDSRVDSIDFVAADRATRAVLEKAFGDFRAARATSGERPCLFVRGQWLRLRSIESTGEREGAPADLRRAHARSRFVLAEEASIQDCAPLLSG